MPGNSADVKIETHGCMTDITQTLYIYYKNSLISTIWSRVWEHSEHFKRLWKNTSEHCFPASKWVLGKCWNSPTWCWIWRSPSRARPFLCPWASFSLPRIWSESPEPFSIRECIPSCSNHGKLPLNFLMHLLVQLQVLFISIYPSRLWIGGIRNKTEPACLGHICKDPHTNALPSLCTWVASMA